MPHYLPPEQAGPAAASPLRDEPYANQLRASGLTLTTATLAGLRPMQDSELPSYAAGRVKALMFPYRGLNGVPNGCHRLRFLPAIRNPNDGKMTRYIQRTGDKVHLYLPPPELCPTDVWRDSRVPILITEGEKKGLAAAQAFATLARATGEPLACAVVTLGGVYNWRNRSFRVKMEDIDPGRTWAVVKIQNEVEAVELEELVAEEMLEIAWDGRQVAICYDTDERPNPAVQQAAFDLAIWLHERQASVFQVRLPGATDHAGAPVKVGLDDFLVRLGQSGHPELTVNPANNHDPVGAAKRLHQLVFAPSERDLEIAGVLSGDQAARDAAPGGGWPFPTPPNPRLWVNKQLNKPGTNPRQVGLRVARAVVADLDEHGARYRDDEGTFHYFDFRSKVLHPFEGNATTLKELRLSSMGTLLLNDYGVGPADGTTLARVADHYAALQPIRSVSTHSVSVALPKAAPDPAFGQFSPSAASATDAFYFQLSDSRVAKVTAENVEIVDNGTDGKLFRSGVVIEPLADGDLWAALQAAADDPRHFSNDERLNADAPDRALFTRGQINPAAGRWYDTLGDVRLQPLPGMTLEQTRTALACLFHVCPWLRRWRGTMMPIELVIAEQGSGKSTLIQIRRSHLLGGPGNLDNAPNDLRDFWTNLHRANGMWVCDNMSAMQRDLQVRMSDEFARLITDPDPAVEARKLFTTADQARLKVDATFAITSTQNPFTRRDLLQRAFQYRLTPWPEGSYDDSWKFRKMADRAGWVADYLLAIRQFFRVVKRSTANGGWDYRYRAHNRLTNFEQAMITMGVALGWGRDEMRELVLLLHKAVSANMHAADATIQALRVFAQSKMRDVGRNDIETSAVLLWANLDNDDGTFGTNPNFRNVVSFHRYLEGNAQAVRDGAGLELDRRGNAWVLRLVNLSVAEAQAGITGVPPADNQPQLVPAPPA